MCVYVWADICRFLERVKRRNSSVIIDVEAELNTGHLDQVRAYKFRNENEFSVSSGYSQHFNVLRTFKLSYNSPFLYQYQPNNNCSSSTTFRFYEGTSI